jgi:hypothetical protein
LFRWVLRVQGVAPIRDMGSIYAKSTGEGTVDSCDPVVVGV